MTDPISPLHAVRQAMVENYALLEHQNSQLGQQLADARSTIEGLVRENGVLREELDTRTQDLQRCQRYAVRLTTRLEGLTDMLKGIASAADAAVDRIDDISQESVRSMDDVAGPRPAPKEPDTPKEPPQAPTGVPEAKGLMTSTPLPVQEPPGSAEEPVDASPEEPPTAPAPQAATRLAASFALLDKAVRAALSPPPPGAIPVATVPLPLYHGPAQEGPDHWARGMRLA